MTASGFFGLFYCFVLLVCSLSVKQICLWLRTCWLDWRDRVALVSSFPLTLCRLLLSGYVKGEKLWQRRMLFFTSPTFLTRFSIVRREQGKHQQLTSNRQMCVFHLTFTAWFSLWQQTWKEESFSLAEKKEEKTCCSSCRISLSDKDEQEQAKQMVRRERRERSQAGHVVESHHHNIR